MSKQTKKRNARIRHILFAVIVLALVATIGFLLLDDPTLVNKVNPFVTATPSPSPTPEPTATPAPTDTPAPTEVPTPEPTETPEPQPLQEIDENSIAKAQKPNNLGLSTEVYNKNGERLAGMAEEDGAVFENGRYYTDLQGVTTFRGNNYRDGGAYGSVPTGASSLMIAYSMDVGSTGPYTGVGWSGQPAIVRWDAAALERMNLYESKKYDGLVEVICAAQDGNIYFLDLSDGTATRDPISVGAPVKGSVTVDPRGLPLLYVGQGTDKVDGNQIECGMRIYSLVDGSLLYFLDGRDSQATNEWYACDSAPLLYGDTLIWPSENGLVYLINLNTKDEGGAVSVSPQVSKYVYTRGKGRRTGIEGGAAAYNHYVYFADNSGLITCLDLKTAKPVWCFDAGDDTDASIVLEEDDKGNVYLYTCNELDLSGKTGKVQLRCLDALLGEEIWKQEVDVRDNQLGGCFATPALGRGNVEDMVFFTVARGVEGNLLIACDKRTGNKVWTLDLGGYAWSSPTISCDSEGNAYLFQATSAGMLHMIDAANGTILTSIELGSNIEGSPALFDDMLVIGTRGGKIYGIEIG